MQTTAKSCLEIQSQPETNGCSDKAIEILYITSGSLRKHPICFWFGLDFQVVSSQGSIHSLRFHYVPGAKSRSLSGREVRTPGIIVAAWKATALTTYFVFGFHGWCPRTHDNFRVKEPPWLPAICGKSKSSKECHEFFGCGTHETTWLFRVH